MMAGKPGDVTHLAFSPDGRLLAASGGNRCFEMWHLPSGEAWGRYESGMRFTDGPPAFHPTRPLCFAHALTGVAVIETDTKKGRVAKPNPDTRYCPGTWDVTPDGESFVGYLSALFGGISRFRREADDALKSDWGVPFDRLTPRSRETLFPLSFRVGPGGRWFVCVEGERGRYGWDLHPRRLSVRSVEDGAVLGTVRILQGTCPRVAVAPTGKLFVTWVGSALDVRDAGELGAEPRRVKNPSRSHFTGAAFHPSGKYLAATSNDRTVKLFDTDTWRVAQSFTWDVGKMRSVAFSRDGSLAAAGSDIGKVVVWDVDL